MADFKRCFECGIRANLLMSNGREELDIYTCTSDMRQAYSNLSEGGGTVTAKDLLEDRQPVEVRPIADPNWKGFPKPVRKYVSG